jgi:hypothetical protein
VVDDKLRDEAFLDRVGQVELVDDAPEFLS